MFSSGSKKDLKRTPSANRRLLSKADKLRLQEDYFVAVQNHNVPEVYRCLEQGVRPNVVHRDLGVSPIHVLAERNDYDLGLRILQYKQIDLEARTSDGYTPLHLTCLFNCKKFLVMLLENGADIDCLDKFDKTPLHLAVERGYAKLVILLVTAGATVNLMDTFQNTPLSISIVGVWNLLIARILLYYGADMRLEGQRTLHIFFETILHCHTVEQIEYVSLLLENGVNVNTRCRKTDRNCLHFVAITGFLELAIFLIGKGAYREVVDCTNRTPHQVAGDQGNFVVADYFQKGYRPPHLLLHLPTNKIKRRVAQKKAEAEMAAAVAKETK